DLDRVLTSFQRKYRDILRKLLDVKDADRQIVTAGGLLKLQRYGNSVFRKISVKLLQPWLSSDAITQTLRPIVCQPGLNDVTVGYDITATHIKTSADKFKFGDCAFSFRCQFGRFAARLDCRATFINLFLRMAERPASTRFHVIEGAGD